MRAYPPGCSTPLIFVEILLALGLFSTFGNTTQAAIAPPANVSILWNATGGTGTVDVDRGEFIPGTSSQPPVTHQTFDVSGQANGRLELSIVGDENRGALPTLVTVRPSGRAFTFRLQDVDAAYPIFLPADGVIITTQADSRSFAEIERSIRQREGRTKLQQIELAPEASFATSAAVNRSASVQTWLGLSRDIRMFRIDEHLETFQPRFAGYDTPLPETPRQPATYAFQFGRGWGPQDGLTRRLEEDVLPILRAEQTDDGIHYEVTMFASLERTPLTAGNLRGTDFLVADRYGHGHMFTPEQAELEKQRHDAEMNGDEEVVLYVRVVASNRGSTPQYAFFKSATPSLATPISPKLPVWQFDGQRGFGVFESGRVFACSTLDGAPAPVDEHSVLLRPGKSTVLECFVPHRPISRERAEALSRQSFEVRLEEARTFWRGKLNSAARWELPEPRMQAMTQAGLLHLDLLLYGREPAAPLLPAIGVYTAIGSESAPIIQYLDSMGWHGAAARALDFFLEKQHASGFMQNFNGYMLETGAVLWTLGEHYRCTHDEAWLRRIHPHVTRAWRYLREWRQRNLLPELKGHGYGMLDGKTADPEDPYRSFMLNGYAYLGLARTAEMLDVISPEEAAECRTEAAALKADIRAALVSALETSPVVPMGDGTWVRAAPPWTNYRGPVMLHADGGSWFTHGSIAARDSLLGPLYLVFQEVLTPHEAMATELLVTQSELMTTGNVAFSQPYYSRHPWVHLQRGETKPFLQAWYGAVSALADRETYTFNEHFFPVSAHKTHEEAWFLMETRWMLYLESGDTLRLLAGAPRAYLRPGARIAVTNAASTFGPLSFHVSVSQDGKSVKAHVTSLTGRKPAAIEFRLPHPQRLPPVSVLGGQYRPADETVRVEAFSGSAEITLEYN